MRQLVDGHQDHPKLDDGARHVFTGSKYDAATDTWNVSKPPVHHII